MADRKLYYVLLAEYPDEGSLLVMAHQPSEAKHLGSILLDGDGESEMAAAEVDAETLAARIAADPQFGAVEPVWGLAAVGRADGGPVDLLAEVKAERLRQDAKWGQQDHPDGTGGDGGVAAAAAAKARCDRAAADGLCTWWLILAEEVTEALAESEPAKLRAELVQVAAVALAWCEAIDRRKVKG